MTPKSADQADARANYDFPGAVRGKYYKRHLETTNVVVLEPDVAKRFKNAASVNRALRAYLKGRKRLSTNGSTTAVRKLGAR